jgi:hypothetical protein
MWPTLKHYVGAFFFDEQAFKRFLFFLGGMLGQIIASIAVFGMDTVWGWSKTELAKHVLVALVGAIGSALPGPKLPPKPETK